jgi:hypothetical protein
MGKIERFCNRFCAAVTIRKISRNIRIVPVSQTYIVMPTRVYALPKSEETIDVACRDVGRASVIASMLFVSINKMHAFVVDKVFRFMI